jgi:hypothetical protein
MASQLALHCTVWSRFILIFLCFELQLAIPFFIMWISLYLTSTHILPMCHRVTYKHGKLNTGCLYNLHHTIIFSQLATIIVYYRNSFTSVLSLNTVSIRVIPTGYPSYLTLNLIFYLCLYHVDGNL